MVWQPLAIRTLSRFLFIIIFNILNRGQWEEILFRLVFMTIPIKTMTLTIDLPMLSYNRVAQCPIHHQTIQRNYSLLILKFSRVYLLYAATAVRGGHMQGENRKHHLRIFIKKQ
jgi:hypothetical protein